MPIVQNKYSHSCFISGKTEVEAVNNLPKVSQQVAEAEFEFESSDNITVPLGKKFRTKNNGENRRRVMHWNGEEGPYDSCKIISRRNEDKLELSSLLIIHLPVICH